MKTFVDNSGRTWSIAINVDAIRRVKALVQVDLLEAVDGKLIERIAGDPILLCDVVYCLCKPQADALTVSDEDFGRAMAGDAIESATAAMLEELVDFFPSRRRILLRKALEKFQTLEDRVLTAAESRLDALEIDKLANEAVETALGGLGPPSGNSPASPA